MTWGQFLLGFVIFTVCFFLIVVILLQRGRGGGLAGAFGGGGGSGTFGAKTGDVFTWITVSFTGVFLLLAVFANFVFDQSAIALDTPTASQPVPGAGGAPGVPGAGGNVTIPLEPGMDPEGIKIEMLTEDGQVIPADVPIEIIEEPAPASGSTDDGSGDGDSDGGDPDSDSGNDGKDPG